MGAETVREKRELSPVSHGDMVAGGELLEKEEVKGLLNMQRDLDSEIIPEVQSFGHVQYAT